MSRTLRLCCLSLFLSSPGAVVAYAQEQTEPDPEARRALEMLRRREVPEATEPYTPEEGQWWGELRAAASAVRAKLDGNDEKEKFLELLRQGLERSYQAPIPNRGATILRPARPTFDKASRNNKTGGSVALVIELKEDGTVGEVRIVQGLTPALDEKATEAVRRMVFLPAVKDRKFVTTRMPFEMSFYPNR